MFLFYAAVRSFANDVAKIRRKMLAAKYFQLLFLVSRTFLRTFASAKNLNDGPRGWDVRVNKTKKTLNRVAVRDFFVILQRELIFFEQKQTKTIKQKEYETKTTFNAFTVLCGTDEHMGSQPAQPGDTVV